MISISQMKPGVLAAGLASAMSLSLLVFAGCSAEAESPTLAAAKAKGLLETSAGAYRFMPTICGIHKEDGVDDIEIGGPGTAPDGEEFYFELSSTANALSVNLGADGPFASADRTLQAGRYLSKEFVVEVSGQTISAWNLVLVDESGRSVEDDATLTIECG